jgi:hypothetical protein
MSEYPIPRGEQYHSCFLRRWRPAFLHPKRKIQICHRADEQNGLKIVPFPDKGANQTSSPQKALEMQGTQPRVKTSIKTPAFTCAASQQLLGSTGLL